MYATQNLKIVTSGRGTCDITTGITDIVRESGLDSGLCNVFVHHTSASLILCENADPAVRRDLETWFGSLVMDGDPRFEHIDEGPDDMSAHIRCILSQSSISIPVERGRLDLGTWQGVFLWEHRRESHQRKVTISMLGDS